MNELTIQREMNPANWQMLESIALTTAGQSQLERAKIAKHLLFCFENDLPLSLAVNGGLYTVNNRVEVEGTVIRAQIRKHPNYDYVIETLTDKSCIMVILENRPSRIQLNNESEPGGWVDIGRVSYTWDDVKQAGLETKDNYKKYPTDMLLNKCTSRAYKRYCPDIFMQSIYVTGEIKEDANITIIDSETGEFLPTIDELIAEHGDDIVLEAMKHGTTIQEILEYIDEQKIE
jgi:hypothetical protein